MERVDDTILNQGVKDVVAFTKSEIEDFLFYEMELLDSWKLEEWIELFDTNAKYMIPSTDLPNNSDPNHSLYLVADDYERIKGRARRLMKKAAHVEYPHAKTQHLVSNIRIKEAEIQDNKEIVKVSANFMVYRSKREIDIFAGEYRYTLEKTNGSIKILDKKVLLAMNSLRPHGKISILL